MFTRKLLELTLFIVYWVGFAYFACVEIYYKKIVVPYGWDKPEKAAIQWPSLAIFVFILVLMYLLLRFLALLAYARCKIQETRLIANTKQKVRLIKENSKKSSSYGGSTNLVFEDEKLKNQKDLNNNKFKRFLSLSNITKPLRGTIMKNGKSLDTVLDIENAPKAHRSKSLEQLIDIYEKPNHEQNMNNRNEKFQKYSITANNPKSGKTTSKHSKSVENLVDYEKNESFHQSSSTGNLLRNFEKSNDVIDGANTLRKAPSAPAQHISAATLPRTPKQKKRLAPAPPSTSTMPRLHQQRPVLGKPPLPPNKNPILLKNVLVSNAKVLDANRNSKNFDSNV